MRAALRQAREVFAEQMAFDRKKAHEMYMDAYRNADNATEQKLVVDSLVKLHGLAEPETKRPQHPHTGAIEHKGHIKHLPENRVLEMANLTPEQDPTVIEGEVVDADGSS